MLNINSTMASILKQKTNSVDVKVIYGNSTVSYEDITDVTITDTLTSKGTWIFGDAPARSLSLSLRGMTRTVVEPYAETIVTETAEGKNYKVVSVQENDEDLSDLDIGDWVIEDDDTEYEDGTTIQENNEEGFNQMTYPLDWTEHPIIVKLGINNQPINSYNDTTIVDGIKASLQEGEEFITFEVDDEEEDDDAESVSIEEALAYLTDDTYEAQQEASTDIQYDYITLGTFYVCDANDVDVDTASGAVDLVAYDAIYYKKDETFTSALTYPVALSSLIQEMETAFSISWSGTIPDVTVPEKAVKGLGFRKILQNLALLTGSNIAVEPEGNFEFLYPHEVDFSITGADYHGISLADDTENITRLEAIYEGDNTYDVYRNGTTIGKTFTFTTNFIDSQQRLDTIATLAGLPIYFQPYALVSPIYPQLELGDIITVRDNNNVDRKLLIADLEISIVDGTICETFSCAVPTNQALGQQGGFSQYIHSLRADLISANTIIADKLDATLANIDTAHISTGAIEYLSSQIIDAQQISAICANLGYLTSTEIEAQYASLNLLNSSYANINQLNSSFASIELLNSSYATIEQLNSSFVSANVLTSSYASLNYLQNNYANITQLNSSYADVGLANITQGALERLFVDTGILTNASISTASVTGMLNSVSINASCITAGTLNVSHLNIYDDDNGIIYAINAQNVSSADLGNLTTYAQTHQFHGNDIVANSITANQIAGGTITGNEIAGNTITANHININDLSALSANIGEITAGFINGDNAYFNMNGGLVRLGSTAGTHTDITQNSFKSMYKDIAFLNIENKKVWDETDIELYYTMTSDDSWRNYGGSYLFFLFDTGDSYTNNGTPYFSNVSITLPSAFDALYTYDLEIIKSEISYYREEYQGTITYPFTVGMMISLTNVKKNGVDVEPGTPAWTQMIADLSAELGEFEIDATLTWIAVDYNFGNIIYSDIANTDYNLGFGNYLNGKNTLACGSANKVSGENGVAIGVFNDTISSQSVAIGDGNYLCSTISGSKAFGTQSTVGGRDAISVGNKNYITDGSTYAFAFGNTSTVDNDYAVSIGTDNYAKGQYSMAIGKSSTALSVQAMAIGKEVLAGNSDALAIGKSSIASGKNAVVIGTNNKSSGDYSFVFGSNSTASVDGSIAIGRNIQSSNTVSIGIGLEVEASGKQAFAVGNNTTARGDNSIAIGLNSYSLGTRNISLGYMAYSYSGYSVVSIGDDVDTSGNFGVSIGHTLVNSGVNALVLGSYNRCDGGSYSSILGYNNQSSYSFTTILGRDNEAGRSEQTVLGKYNEVNNTALFVVGNGNANVRQNALEMDNDGNLVVAGTVNEYADVVSTSNYTKFITPASGITIRHCSIVRSGRMCQFTISFTKNTSVACANYGDISDITVGTLKDAYLPRVTTHFSHGGMVSPVGTDGTITEGGSMVCRTVKPRSATTFTANNTTFMARGTYLLYNKWQKS